jgi:hypothetical protein
MDLKLTINECISHFDVDLEMNNAEEAIREENHESIVDCVIEELDLDDWDGDLETASRRVLREYESWMEDRINDEIDVKIAQQIKEHISKHLEGGIISSHPEEMASLEQALLQKVKHHNLELDYPSFELAGLVYSNELPDSPFMYHQTTWETDENYRTFLKTNYVQITTLTLELLHQYQVAALGMIPNVATIVEERWKCI